MAVTLWRLPWRKETDLTRSLKQAAVRSVFWSCTLRPPNGTCCRLPDGAGSRQARVSPLSLIGRTSAAVKLRALKHMRLACARPTCLKINSAASFLPSTGFQFWFKHRPNLRSSRTFLICLKSLCYSQVPASPARYHTTLPSIPIPHSVLLWI